MWWWCVLGCARRHDAYAAAWLLFIETRKRLSEPQPLPIPLYTAARPAGGADSEQLREELLSLDRAVQGLALEKTIQVSLRWWFWVLGLTGGNKKAVYRLADRTNAALNAMFSSSGPWCLAG